jgi:hypothetical protein
VKTRILLTLIALAVVVGYTLMPSVNEILQPPAVSTNETTLHQSTSAVESEPAIKEMSQYYLLARLAEELGTNGAATSIRDQLTSAGFQDRDFGNWKRK